MDEISSDEISSDEISSDEKVDEISSGEISSDGKVDDISSDEISRMKKWMKSVAAPPLLQGMPAIRTIRSVAYFANT